MSEDEDRRSRLVKQDSHVFERLYYDHFPRVRNFLRVYLGDVAAIDDLTQDTFLQLWSRPDAFDPSRSSIRTYLLGIARKKAADWWRHREPVAEEKTEQASSTNADVQVLALTDALGGLEPELRNILWLREAEGYTYQELAEVLDIPLGTVKSRLFTAREQLRHTWLKRKTRVKREGEDEA
jgi:RNA polymerase sigma-70 factor, ECF subfamily